MTFVEYHSALLIVELCLVVGLALFCLKGENELPARPFWVLDIYLEVGRKLGDFII